MKKIIILTAAALFFTVSITNAQSNDKYKQMLKTYMAVSSTDTSFDLAMDQIIKMMAPNESEQRVQEITAKVAPEAMSSLIDLMAPIYEKHLSLSALEEAVKFYSTPAGKEIAKSQGAITVESMQVGQQWGMSLQGLITNAMK